MKKIITILLASLAVGLYSCSEFEPGGTASKNIAGNWYVTVSVPGAEEGEWEEISNYFEIATYNTAANTPGQFFIDDQNHYWHFKGKVVANPSNYSFGAINDTVQNYSYDSRFVVYGGKVLKGMGRSVSGVKTDSIVFYVKFDDDAPEPYITEYKFSGHRKTGYLEDML